MPVSQVVGQIVDDPTQQVEQIVDVPVLEFQEGTGEHIVEFRVLAIKEDLGEVTRSGTARGADGGLRSTAS